MQVTLKRTGHSHTQSSDSVLEPVLDIDRYWPEAAPLVERVLARMDPQVDVDSIYRDLLSRDRQMWAVRKDGALQAVILTMIEDYRGLKTGYINYAAGEDFEAWESAVDPIAGYFAAEGCDRFVINGRRGWKKYLENRGFMETTTIFERCLNG